MWWEVSLPCEGAVGGALSVSVQDEGAHELVAVSCWTASKLASPGVTLMDLLI